MASKSKNIAELLDVDGDVLPQGLENISINGVTINTSDGSFTLVPGDLNLPTNDEIQFLIRRATTAFSAF